MGREELGNGVVVRCDSLCPVTSDALLLAEFAAPGRGERAVDLCSGNGIVPLLWFAQGKDVAAACGLEMQPGAVALMEGSIAESGLEGRLTAVRGDLRALPAELSLGDWDFVSCNPPYGEAGAGRINPREERRLARHEEGCTLDEVARAAALLLREGGRFAFCHRPRRLPELLETLRRHRLEPKRLRLVQAREDTPPWLVLVEARKGGKPSLEVEPVLVLEDPGER